MTRSASSIRCSRPVCSWPCARRSWWRTRSAPFAKSARAPVGCGHRSRAPAVRGHADGDAGGVDRSDRDVLRRADGGALSRRARLDVERPQYVQDRGPEPHRAPHRPASLRHRHARAATAAAFYASWAATADAASTPPPSRSARTPKRAGAAEAASPATQFSSARTPQRAQAAEQDPTARHFSIRSQDPRATPPGGREGSSCEAAPEGGARAVLSVR